ncbi:hypothetical protein [Streptomyces hydrogenans]|uniref:hypothetical protein n=1 Tax=Streptomyces hydrogenans TaxID=1873719 RepID=UPI0033ED2BDE
MTARELADRFGVSPRTVLRMVSEERATYEGRSRQRRDRILELHRQGLKGYEIASELSVSTGLVSIRLKEARAAGVDLTPYAAAGEEGEQNRAGASRERRLPGRASSR